MNITLISEYFPYSGAGDITGGVESRCFNIAKQLAKKHKINVITSWKKNEKRNYNLKNINIHKVGINHPYSNKGNLISRFIFAIAAYKKAKSIKSDIIDGYNFISYLPAYFASKKTNCKNIATYHETWKGEWIKNKGFISGMFGEVWERAVLSKKWDKIISVSKYTKDRIKSKTKREDIIIIPNGINIKEYSKIEKKYDKPTVCCVSRLTKQKRVKDLILAINKLKKIVPNISCIIIGQGPEENEIKETINKLKLNENIILKGYVKDHKEVIKILKKSDIFCLPSVLEGFGIVLIESCSANIPYVCADIEVLKETTKQGRGGLFFEKENSRDLSKKLLKLIYDQDLYLKKYNETKTISKEYDWKEISKKIEKIYLETI